MAVSHVSEDEKALIEAIREIAQERVAPRAAEIDHSGEFPWDMKELLASHDILAMPFPEEYGGIGASELAISMAVEELSRCCATTGLILAVQQLGSMPILLAGNDEQKRKYFPRLASGEWLAAFGLTEAGSGSDAAAMQTFAVRKGDKYILNGSKRFITNGGLAQVNSIFAITDPQAGTRGISAFIVEKDFPGFSVGRIEDKMGIKGSQTAELIFENCEVPVENLLGGEGEGFKIAMRTLDRTRIGIGAQALGIAQGALDLAVAYAKQRVQFKKPIAENQGIQFMLADMATKVEAARLLVYHASELVDDGDEQFSKYSSMAKMFASDAAMDVTNDAIQVLGGYGYMKEYPAERMLRDAKITQIYEGTNQIQRLVIARALLSERNS
ncbi:acyl-CoA dehydrogenase [Ktedonobacter sp. SOSP1-85]|uniref:acyl-CoA dehydrogenase n=1 Tax=unclassified Ktedonobacter TaxID=388461 RepID=UPI0019155D40|nr:MULTISPECIES: acyl-CoA dehydrogenase [unclassified Ktedonobacter]GHO67056.1 acyl-CoA dehydrogenase [Ktedonobacter sp. SOSP1-52]GHO73685.1 acyl-CoA dehydrogenase [Ktedonobacter sp. SOSP1-85]